MKSLRAWIAVQKPTALDPSLNVDAGELEAICLAREIHAAAMLIDDRAPTIRLSNESTKLTLEGPSQLPFETADRPKKRPIHHAGRLRC